MKYKDKTVWITGASSGIGEALAREFTRQGAGVILSARNTEKLEKLANELAVISKTKPGIVELDLENNQSINNAVTHVKNNYDKVDILVNNAGISQRSLVIETPVEIDRKVFEINFFGTITLTKALLPYMIASGGGQIVVMSSVVGKFGFPLRSAYSASKHALHGFFDTLRSELSKQNIKVTIVCPGRILTNVSINAITKDGTAYGKMDEGQARGLPADVFARRLLRAIRKGRKEIATGGKEVLMVYIRRFLPWLYYIMASKVKPT
ncbi:MAG: SDR family oxidoreductase [Bacteroidales bacterium]|nr:SDR family oxidoreductase [Bacteroidales bacterium]